MACRPKSLQTRYSEWNRLEKNRRTGGPFIEMLYKAADQATSDGLS